MKYGFITAAPLAWTDEKGSYKSLFEEEMKMKYEIKPLTNEDADYMEEPLLSTKAREVPSCL